MRRPTASVVSLVLVSLLLAAGPVRAQQDPFAGLSDAQVEVALDLLDQAEAAEAQADWDAAVRAYRALAEIVEVPHARLREATALEQAGDAASAAAVYEELSACGVPEIEAQAAQALDRLRAEVEPTTDGPEPASGTTPGADEPELARSVDSQPEPTARHRWVAPAMLGVAAAGALAVGGVYGAKAVDRADAHDTDPLGDPGDSLADEAHQAQHAANALFAVGGALGVGAVTAAILSATGKDRSRAQLGAFASRDGGALNLAYRW